MKSNHAAHSEEGCLSVPVALGHLSQVPTAVGNRPEFYFTCLGSVTEMQC